MDTAEDREGDDEDVEKSRSVVQIIADARARIVTPKTAFVGKDYARDLIDDLWAAGWTIDRRRRGDPFFVDPKIIPVGVAYQWNEAGTDSGWVAVPAARHEGVFTPCGYKGDIVINGMVLCERSKQVVDAANERRVAKAHKNVDDWYERMNSSGFSGGVRTWTGPIDAPPPEEFRLVGKPEIFKEIAPTISQALFPALPVVPPATQTFMRRPRREWLRWLFNLISIEEKP